MKWIGKIFIVLLIAFDVLSAQQFSVQLSSKTNPAGSPFEYQVVLPAAPEEIVKWPDFSGLQVMSGPNQMSSYQNINGQASSQFIISWILISSSSGKYTITAPKFKLNGKVLNGPATVVEITASGSSNASKSSRDSKSLSVTDPIFVKTGISRTKLYVGESVEVTQTLYSAYPILAYQKPMQTEYSGFYAKPIGQEQHQLQNEQINGRMYYTHTPLRTQITALKPGKQILKTSSAQIIIRRESQRQSQNILEQIFGGNSYEEVSVAVQANPISVDVLALPEINKPQGFTGSVGNFNIRANASATTLNVNEACNIKIIIEGNGNFNLVQLPKWLLSDSIEVYEPKITTTDNSKTFDYTIVPRFPGRYNLGPVVFCYFDSKTERYYSKSTPLLELQVKGSVSNQTTTWKAKITTESSSLGSDKQDIRYVEKTFNSVSKPDVIPLSWWYIVLCVATTIVFLLHFSAIGNLFKFYKKPKNRIYNLINQEFIKLKYASQNPADYYQSIIKIWESYFTQINTHYQTQFHYLKPTSNAALNLVLDELKQNLEQAQQFAYAKQTDDSNVITAVDAQIKLLKNIHAYLQHELS